MDMRAGIRAADDASGTVPRDTHSVDLPARLGQLGPT